MLTALAARKEALLDKLKEKMDELKSLCMQEAVSWEIKHGEMIKIRAQGKLVVVQLKYSSTRQDDNIKASHYKQSFWMTGEVHVTLPWERHRFFPPVSVSL